MVPEPTATHSWLEAHEMLLSPSEGAPDMPSGSHVLTPPAGLLETTAVTGKCSPYLPISTHSPDGAHEILLGVGRPGS